MDSLSYIHILSEVFTGRHPFSEFTAPITISKILSGERPDRPQDPGLTNSLWDMALCCWDQDPIQRPAMTSVVGILREWLVFFLFAEPISYHTSTIYSCRLRTTETFATPLLGPWGSAHVSSAAVTAPLPASVSMSLQTDRFSPPPPVGSYGSISTVSPSPQETSYAPVDEGKLSVSIDFGTPFPNLLKNQLRVPNSFVS